MVIQIPQFQPILITPTIATEVVFAWKRADITYLFLISKLNLNGTFMIKNNRQRKIIGIFLPKPPSSKAANKLLIMATFSMVL